MLFTKSVNFSYFDYITYYIGWALDTHFQLSCRHWVDEGNRLRLDDPGCNGELRYSVTYKHPDEDKLRMLYVGTEEKPDTFLLAPGKKENGYILYLYVRVMDKFVDFQEMMFEVKVNIDHGVNVKIIFFLQYN